MFVDVIVNSVPDVLAIEVAPAPVKVTLSVEPSEPVNLRFVDDAGTAKS